MRGISTNYLQVDKIQPMTSHSSRQEFLRWKPFVLNEQVYDLSHLDSHWVEYQDNRGASHLR